MTFAIGDAELNLAETRRAENLTTDQLRGAETFDEVPKVALGSEPNSQPRSTGSEDTG